MVVVDDLDERLDLAALALTGLGHAAGDLLGVTLDSGDEGVRERVGLAAVVLGLDNHDLLSGITTTGDDGLESEGGYVSLNAAMGLVSNRGVAALRARDVPHGRP